MDLSWPGHHDICNRCSAETWGCGAIMCIWARGVWKLCILLSFAVPLKLLWKIKSIKNHSRSRKFLSVRFCSIWGKGRLVQSPESRVGWGRCSLRGPSRPHAFTHSSPLLGCEPLEDRDCVRFNVPSPFAWHRAWRLFGAYGTCAQSVNQRV